MKPQTQAITEAEKAARIAHLQAKEELTLAEQTELDQLTGDEVPFDPAHHTFEEGQVGGISPAEEKHLTATAKREAKPRRPRAAKPKPEEKPHETALQRLKLTFDPSDTEGRTGKFEFLNTQGAVETAALETLRTTLVMVFEGQPKRFRLIAEE